MMKKHVVWWMMHFVSGSVALFTRNFYSASPNGIPHSRVFDTTQAIGIEGGLGGGVGGLGQG